MSFFGFMALAWTSWPASFFRHGIYHRKNGQKLLIHSCSGRTMISRGRDCLSSYASSLILGNGTKHTQVRPQIGGSDTPIISVLQQKVKRVCMHASFRVRRARTSLPAPSEPGTVREWGGGIVAESLRMAWAPACLVMTIIPDDGVSIPIIS